MIVPTYNERENINHLVGQCLGALPQSEFQVEILIVDDDSDDYTWQYPIRLFSEDPRVRVIRRQTDDTGLAQSVADGCRAARHDYCAVIDADLQHPPKKLPELFAALDDGADIAIGSRHVQGGRIENWPTCRKLVSRGATTCARIAIPDARGISDPMSGFFAVHRDVLDRLALDPKGYKILLEILGRVQYETVVEVPFVFRERERGESKLTGDEYKHFLEHLGQLAIVNRGLNDVVGPNRAVRATEFGIVGATGVLVNMIVFAAATLVGNMFYLVAGVVAFFAAINWNFAGNWLLTFDQPRTDIFQQYVRFHLVSVVGFIVYVATLTGTVGVGVPPLLANGGAILAGAAFNFLGYDMAVFPTEDPDERAVEATGKAVTREYGTPSGRKRGNTE